METVLANLSQYLNQLHIFVTRNETQDGQISY